MCGSRFHRAAWAFSWGRTSAFLEEKFAWTCCSPLPSSGPQIHSQHWPGIPPPLHTCMIRIKRVGSHSELRTNDIQLPMSLLRPHCSIQKHGSRCHLHILRHSAPSLRPYMNQWLLVSPNPFYFLNLDIGLKIWPISMLLCWKKFRVIALDHRGSRTQLVAGPGHCSQNQRAPFSGAKSPIPPGRTKEKPSQIPNFLFPQDPWRASSFSLTYDYPSPLSPGWVLKPAFNPGPSSCSHPSLAAAWGTCPRPSWISAVHMLLTYS